MTTQPSVPFLSYEQIQSRVESFRKRYPNYGTSVPVDAELLAELSGLEIVPVPLLIKDGGVDAVYLHRTSQILVDYDQFTNESHWSRLRFSIAHEIGHHELHRQILLRVPLQDMDQWIEFVASWESTDRLEIQAGEFAGRLLVPRERLIHELKRLAPRAREFSSAPEEYPEKLAIMVSKVFAVSEEVIHIRIKREELTGLIG